MSTPATTRPRERRRRLDPAVGGDPSEDSRDEAESAPPPATSSRQRTVPTTAALSAQELTTYGALKTLKAELPLALWERYEDIVMLAGRELPERQLSKTEALTALLLDLQGPQQLLDSVQRLREARR